MIYFVSRVGVAYKMYQLRAVFFSKGQSNSTTVHVFSSCCTVSRVSPAIIGHVVSLNTGVVPRDWRCANVSPVYKKGEKYIAENYRPISLTCICCKLMEHIVTSHIMSHADNNSILYPLQHGFRSKRSCETQLVEFVQDITCNMAAGKQTDILIRDFSKAFDKVCHSLLVHKLRHYGIKGKVNQWIGNFLSGRSQQVVLSGERSGPPPPLDPRMPELKKMF